MTNARRSAAVLLVLATACSSKETGYHVPSTISAEAQEILRSYSPADREHWARLAPDDLDGWAEIAQEHEEDGREPNAAIVRRYGPSLRQTQLGGVPIVEITPADWQENGKRLVYAHGGAFTMLSAMTTLGSSVPVAHATGLRVLSVDYTRAPFAKHGTITDQVVSVMQALVEQGHDLGDIAIYGDSAGGAIAAAVVLKMRDRGLGMPAAVVLLSPWVDVTETGDTYHTLRDHDPAYLYSLVLRDSANAYAAREEQKQPYVSPVYGDFTTGFPPTLIQGGTKEIFLSNFVRLYQALDGAGRTVKLDLYEGMWHVWQATHPELPESRSALRKIAAFLEVHLKGGGA